MAHSPGDGSPKSIGQHIVEFKSTIGQKSPLHQLHECSVACGKQEKEQPLAEVGRSPQETTEAPVAETHQPGVDEGMAQFVRSEKVELRQLHARQHRYTGNE